VKSDTMKVIDYSIYELSLALC